MARKAQKAKAIARPAPVLKVDAASWPAHSREEWPIGRLLPYANNARTHSDAQVRQIAALIAEFGWTSPVLVDETGGILAGHGRVLAARLLGITMVPVMIARGWTAAQKRAYVLADNKVAENAGWDKQLLAIEMTALRDMPDFDLAMVGFSQAELDRLLDDPEREGHGDSDADAPPARQAVSRRGDVWILGDHRLLCGDSTDAADVALVLGLDRPHLMVTDPPYGVEYDPTWRAKEQIVGNLIRQSGERPADSFHALGTVSNDDRADWRDAWSLFAGDVAYVWHASLFSPEVVASLEAGGLLRRNLIVWNKSQFVIGRGHYHWKHELCWYVVRDGATGHWAGGRDQATVWDINVNSGFLTKIEGPDARTGHGTQKPVECMKRPMINNSRPGDCVYEPFCGSGTTIIAGEILERRVRAIEIDPAYVDAAVNRWERFTKKRAILAGGEQVMEQVAEARGITLAAA